MQKYNNFHKLMFTYRFLMFKIREFMDFKHKITHFRHFAHPNSKFFYRNMRFLEKFS